MTLSELKTEVKKYMRLEDEGVIDVALASIVATRLKLGSPIWLIIIGISSGGKSQILRPLALTDTKFMHKIDDLTENTFLSGMGSKDKQMSLLHRIGSLGMLVMSDLTVLFSKNAEARGAILSQFRIIYDGEMTKYSGTSDKAITWKGALGVLAGSTPSIYRHFEEAADMGERFIYYRMKPSDNKAEARVAQHRKLIGTDLDNKLADLYGEYLKSVVGDFKGDAELPEEVYERILDISVFAERIRTPVHMDWRGTEIDDIPITASPARLALQLSTLAKGLMVMRGGTLGEDDVRIIEWCGYSLANEKKRHCLRVLGTAPFGAGMRTQTVADVIGLSTAVTNRILQSMASIGLLKRTGDEGSLLWHIAGRDDYDRVRSIEGITTFADMGKSRVLSKEEADEIEMATNQAFERFGAPV